ncbi:MAG: amidohydrolase family protein [Bdellovibrionales bacterium]|jgi:dihydroorotase|nr:amidohydrolase family protein [Bdellovibrionales bacterium]MBT3525437.1 amidohydrolase family protein [Bdellovibrionales bacterium]MBT7767050.1 amidohydrolase family protein [Bdellovibrionales bacterium]
MIKVIEGEIVTPEKKFHGQIAFNINSGLIEQLGEQIVPADKVDQHFEQNHLIFPGMIDLHVHARQDQSGTQNYKETFSSAALAAINGGVTCFGDMPNNSVPPIDLNSYQEKFQLTSDTEMDIFLYAGVTSKSSPLPMVVPYKLYLGGSTNISSLDGKSLREKLIAPYRGMAVSFHCEDGEILQQSANAKTHSAKRPVAAEVVAIEEALNLIKSYQLKGTICHCSTAEGMEMIISARKQGVDVKVEVAPSHLYFNQQDVGDDKTYQMNPPIRDRHDQQSLIKALRQGHVDFLATDHAPHTEQEKRRGVSGLTGLDTYGPFICWLIKEHNITPQRIAQICCANPGEYLSSFLPTLKQLQNECFGRQVEYGKGVGRIEAGYLANFTILNLSGPVEITRNYLKSRCAQSPFLGRTLPGGVARVIIRGKIIS